MLVLATMVLSLAGALSVDWLSHRAGLTPPGFLVHEGQEDQAWVAMLRRSLAIMLLAGVFWVGVFGALATLGQSVSVDFGSTGVGALFVLHAIFAAVLTIWYLLGFAGFRGFPWNRQFGLVAKSVGKEIGIGLAAGVAGWMAVIAALLAIGAAVMTFGGQDALPQTPPPMVTWIAGLPILARLAISMSAGVFEELFFRGFLQPRVGIGLSSLFFVLAHANYEQPMMLVGVGLLSLIFAFLVRWRQSIWAAGTAHALFDAIQLLVVVPIAIEFLENGGEVGPWLPVAWLG